MKSASYLKASSRVTSHPIKETTMTHLDHIRSTELYEFLKDIPKGVLHHDHFDCN